MRAITIAIVIRASRSDIPTFLSASEKCRDSRASSARRSHPTERPLSISRLSSWTFAVSPISASSAACTISRLRNLCTMASAVAVNSGAGSKRNSFPVSLASMISTSSAHWALGMAKCAPRLSSVFSVPCGQLFGSRPGERIDRFCWRCGGSLSGI